MSQVEYEYQKGEQIHCAFLVRLMSEVSKTPTRTFRIGSLIPFWQPSLKMAARDGRHAPVIRNHNQENWHNSPTR